MRVGLSCHLDQALVVANNPSSFSRPDSRGRLSPPEHLRRNKEWNNAEPGW
jgi:hypothetical protein